MRSWASWVHVLGYALLASALAAAALAFASVRVLDDAHIPGSGPGYRYYALGVQRSTGPSFSMNSAVVAQIDRVLPSDVRAAMVIGQEVQLRSASGAGSVVRTQAELATGDYLRTLHVPVVAGRSLRPEDVADCRPVIVLAAGVAAQLFGSSAQAIGRSVQMMAHGRTTGTTLQVISVVADGFHGLQAQQSAHAWAPLLFLPELNGAHFPMCEGKHPHNGAIAFSIAGMPGVFSAPAGMSRAQLDTVLQGAWQRLPAAARGKDETGLVVAAPYSESPLAQARQAQRSALYLSLALAALVLAAINIFTLRWLALVRGRHVLQLERVLGATRAFLQRRYVLRTSGMAVVLLLASGLFGVGGALLLRHLAGAGDPGLARLGLSALGANLMWALPLALVIVVLVESLPLLMLRRREQLDGDARLTVSRSDRNIGLLVLAVEVLLASVVSCTAAWSVHYAWQQQHASLGLLRSPMTIVNLQRRPADAQTMIMLQPAKGDGAPAQVLLFDALERTVRVIEPGARMATGPLPLGQNMRNPVSVTAGTRTTSVDQVVASPGWFDLAGVHLLAGHEFDTRRIVPDAVLIDAGTARALFGGVRAAVGANIQYDGEATRRVIGVIAPVFLDGPDHDAVPVLISDFRSGFSVFPYVGGALLLRPLIAADRHPALRHVLDAALQRQASMLQVAHIEQSPRLLDRLTRAQTRQAQLFVLIALFAWAITLSGIATHVRLYLALRRRVTAITAALGASPGWLYGSVIGSVVLLAVIAIVLTLLFTPWLAQQFALLSGAQVAPFGVATWIALAVLLLAVFLVAHFPARRAARAEPAESLHEL